MKAHIGRRGKGTQPICNGGTRVTSGYITDRESFRVLDTDFQCTRCRKRDEREQLRSKPIESARAGGR